jgi:hypothetical protein
MTSNTPEQTDRGDADDAFKIDFIKSNYFRVVHADGVWGGLTPQNEIHMAVWNGRNPFPRRLNFKIKENGEIEDLPSEIRCDQIRELEVGIVMSIEVARSIRQWLDGIIGVVELTSSQNKAHE